MSFAQVPESQSAAAPAARTRTPVVSSNPGAGLLALRAGSAVLAVVFLIGALYTLVKPASSSASRRSGAGASATVRSNPDDPRAAIDAAVIEAKSFVESVRRIQFKTPVVTVLSNKDFLARLDSDEAAHGKEVADRLTSLEAFFHATGLLPPSVHLADLDDEGATEESGVLGFYDPKTKELVIRSSGATASVGALEKVIIVHELTHALDDQMYGLDRPLWNEGGDRTQAWKFLVEGSARWVENQYRDTLTPMEKREVENAELSLFAGIDAATVKRLEPYQPALEYLDTTALAPYEVGKLFVNDVIVRFGVSGLDSVYAHPPVNTESATYLKEYLKDPDGLSAPSLAPPPAKALSEVIDEGAIGQLGLAMLIGGRDPARRGEAVSTLLDWNGDSFVLYKTDGKPCFSAEVQLESRGAARRLVSLLERRVPELLELGLSFEMADVGYQGVRWTSCAG